MEWIKVDERLPQSSGVIMIKLENGATEKAYYHEDGMSWARYYFKFPQTRFQSFKTKEWITNVTEWKPLLSRDAN